MRLLDTNVLSQLTRTRPDPAVIEELRQWHSDTVFASVVTRNTRHFEAVPGIALENWFTTS